MMWSFLAEFEGDDTERLTRSKSMDRGDADGMLIDWG
jgi:hypothetical protein